jgi:hypothetical protein
MSLSTGEAAPWFTARTASSPEFAFDTAAGRYVLLLFLPVEEEIRGAALKILAQNQRLFDDVKASCFVVVRDPETAASVRDLRGLRWFIDLDLTVSRLFSSEQPRWILLDPTLRVMGGASMEASVNVFKTIAALPPPEQHAGVPLIAPVMIEPRIFEPELCRALIDLHESDGGRFTGVMRDVDGATVHVMDELKRRRDVLIADPDLRRAVDERLQRRLFPLIKMALGFSATEIERHLVACYDAADGAVFRPHRDNTTQGTAARQFACSINLNDDYEGGDLRFPEYGLAVYRPPPGGAAVFSCGVLHEATAVTRGRRYAFLPFLYDAAGAAARAQRPAENLETAS